MPQMRNLVNLSSHMWLKLSIPRSNTISTMKLSITQSSILKQSVKFGPSTDAVVQANNTTLKILTETNKKAIPTLETTTQLPTPSLKSVTTIIECLVHQNNRITSRSDNSCHQQPQLEAILIKSTETNNDFIKLHEQKIVQPYSTRANLARISSKMTSQNSST